MPEAVGAPVEVTLNRSGTATSGVDYTLAETVTIPAGTSATATLQVIDDRIDEGTETVEVQASADGYGPSDAVAVPIGDDDSAGLTVTPTDLSLTEGGSGQYEVRLDSQPLHPVTITMASSNPDVEAPTPLSFTADNWNQLQAVTVTVAYDDDATDESATVTHTAESGDLNYQGIPVPSVSVSVSDDDNQPPRCDSIATRILRVADSQTVDLSAYCSDPDGHPLTYSARSLDEDNVTVTVSGSRLTLTGVAVGSATIRVTATDQPGDSQDSLSTTESFTARVDNRDPDCDDIADQTVDKGKSKTLTVSCTDRDGHSLRYSARSSPTGIVTVPITDEGVLTITGTAVGTATVTVTASDGHRGSEEVEFSVTVERVNERPVCSNIPVQVLWVADSQTVELSQYCSDPDGHNLTYSATSSAPSKVRVTVTNYPNSNRGTLTLTGKAVTSSPHPTITVTATDDPENPEDSLSTTETFTARVDNRGPVCSFSRQTLDVNQSKDLGVTAHCTDADGDRMTYTAASSLNSSIASASRRNNNTTVRITGKSAGSTRVTVTVEDDHGASTTESFSVTVNQPPPPPSCDLSSIGGQTLFPTDSRRLSLSSACDLQRQLVEHECGSVSQHLTITRGIARDGNGDGLRVTKSGYKPDSVSFVTVNPRPGSGGLHQRQFDNPRR